MVYDDEYHCLTREEKLGIFEFKSQLKSRSPYGFYWPEARERERASHVKKSKVAYSSKL